MADFRPSIFDPFPLIAQKFERDRVRAQLDAMAREEAQRRHDQEFERATQMVAAGDPVKSVRALPQFNSVLDSEWNILAEREKRKRKAEVESNAGEAAGLAQQVAGAQTGIQKQAAQDRLAGLGIANDPTLLNALASNIQTVQQASEADERAKLIAQRLDLAKSGRASFVTNAAKALAGGSMDPVEIRRNAVSQFGEENATVILSQIATAAAADAAAQSDNPIDFYISDGASPTLARLADKGLAFKEPMTGLYVRGKPGSARFDKAASYSSIQELMVQLEVASENFASAGGGTAFTGTLEAMKKKLGPDADPFFAELEVIRSNLQLIIANARSGKTLNEREITLLEKSLLSDAEIRLVDGKLSPSFISRMTALQRVIDSEMMQFFDADQRPEAKRRLVNGRAKVAEAMRGAGAVPATSVTDPEGDALLNQLKNKLGVAPGASP